MTSSVNENTHVPETVNIDHEPYVGPRPFKREDRDIFFGRYRETLEVTSLIKAHPDVLLYAQSGAGKTSLIYAQLITTLELEEEFHVLPPARVRSQQTRRIPDEKIRNIYMFNALRDLSDDKLSPMDRAQITLAEYLKRLPRPPLIVAGGTEEPPQIQSGKNLAENQTELRLPRAIIFDQFEEIFTLYQDRYKDRLDFFLQVAAALEADPFLRVVFSMREDYIAELDPYVDVLPQKLSTRFRLERLRMPNALAAVTKPLEAERVTSDRKFAENAAKLLVESLMMIKVKTATGEKKEVLGEFVDPVQLQVVCQTLWEKLPPEVTTITEAHLKKYANVDEALLAYYENSVHKAVLAGNAAIEGGENAQAKTDVQTVSEGTVRRWFERFLITREGKRSMVFRGDKKTGTLPNEVVDELDKQHLIRGEMRGDDTWYELSHDRFISPIKESNQRWIRLQSPAKQMARALEARTIEWLGTDKDHRLLLDRAELIDAQNWRQTPEAEAIEWSNDLDSLIRQSEAAVESEDRRQLELLAKEQQLRANAEQRRARQFRLGLVIASLLLVVASIATVYAYKARAKANENYEQAQGALRKATDAEAAAVASAENAKQEKTKAEKAASDLSLANTDLGFAIANVDQARISAETEKTKAVKAKREAESEKTKAMSAHREADKARAAAQAKNEQLIAKIGQSHSRNLSLELSQHLTHDPELSLRLAITAENKSSTTSARYSLRQAYFEAKEHSILHGHDDSVRQALFSPDGRQIITISDDRDARVWNRSQGKDESVPLSGHKGPVSAVVASHDGSRIATEAADGTARVWWLKDGSFKQLEGLTGPEPAIAFSRDGKLLATEATIDEDKAGYVANIWDAEDPKNVAPLFTLKGHEEAVSAIAFSPVEDHVATASLDGTARIWNTIGKSLTILRGHTARLNSVAFDPTGKFVVTSSHDSTARVWQILTGKEVMTLRGHLGYVTDASFSPDGRLILTVATRKIGVGMPEDNVVRVWDANSGLLMALLSRHTKPITDATFSPDSKMVVTASEDGTANVYRATTGEHVRELRGHSGPVFSAVFSPDGQSVLTAGADLTAQVWSVPADALKENSFRATGNLGDARVNVNFSDDGTLVTASTDGEVRFWNAQTKQEIANKKIIVKPPEEVPEIPSAYLLDIAGSPDNKFLAMAFRINQFYPSSWLTTNVRIWDSREQKYTILNHKAPVYRVIYSPKGKFVLTASIDGSGTLWDTSTWKPLHVLRPTPLRETGQPDQKGSQATSEPNSDAGVILHAAFDPSEKFVVTAQEGGTIQLWETSTGASQLVRGAHDLGVLSVGFNQQGNLFVTGGYDKAARVWTLSGENILTLSGHMRAVYEVRFSNNGTFIVTTGRDNTARVWEAETGALVAIYETPEVPASVALSPNNRGLIVGSVSGLVHVFECEACHPFEEIKRLAIRSNPRQLTKLEKLQFGLFNDEELPEKNGKENR